MGRTIVVSDLHVNTWDPNRLIMSKDRRNLPKHEHFFEFLAWCERRGVDSVVINGDLLDVPPYQGHAVFTAPGSVAAQILAQIETLASRIRVNLVVGNHDIGVGAFQWLGLGSISQLKGVDLCYPGCVIDSFAAGCPDSVTGTIEKTVIMVDHGHFSDPVLRQYMQDFGRIAYSWGDIGSFTWTQQSGVNATPPSNASQPVPIVFGQTAYQTARDEQDNSDPDVHALKAATPPIWDVATRELRRRLWWGEGLEQMDHYLTYRTNNGMPAITRLYLIEGHTHLDDARDARAQKNVNCLYINSGSWIGDSDRASYVEIDSSGRAWLQDWIQEPLKVKEAHATPAR